MHKFTALLYISVCKVSAQSFSREVYSVAVMSCRLSQTLAGTSTRLTAWSSATVVYLLASVDGLMMVIHQSPRQPDAVLAATEWRMPGNLVAVRSRAGHASNIYARRPTCLASRRGACSDDRQLPSASPLPAPQQTQTRPAKHVVPAYVLYH